MRRNVTAELIIFRILVHGPVVIFDYLPAIKRFYRMEYTTFREIRWALIEAGMMPAEIMEIVLGRHEIGCACWRCVLMLQGQIVKRYHLRLARLASKED